MELKQHDWVMVSDLKSKHWTPDETGSYPQPRVEKHMVEQGNTVYEDKRKRKVLEGMPNFEGQLGRVQHVLHFPKTDENGMDIEEKEEEATYAVRFGPEIMEECSQDWFLFSAEDLRVVEPTEDEQFEYFTATLLGAF